MKGDVARYFDAVPEPRKARLLILHEAVLECFPDAVIDLRYRMPTYCHGEGWVAIANQKSYVSLYTCGAHHLAAFKRKYPHYKTGKGCINFRARDILPMEDVKAVIRHAMLHPKGE